MARWDTTRSCWRICATAYTPGSGARRQRRYKDVAAPHNREGKVMAELAEAQFRAEVGAALAMADDGQLPRGSFGEAAWAWHRRGRDPKGKAWSPATKVVVAQTLRRRILPHLGTVPFDRVTAGQVEDMYLAWADDGIAPATITRWHSMVSTIFEQLRRRRELTKDNPCEFVSVPGGGSAERRPPTPAEVRRVIDAVLARPGRGGKGGGARNATLATFFELAAETGARKGTLVALRWADVDLERGTITCLHAITKGEGGVQHLKGTKADKPYAVRLAATGRALAGLRDLHRRALETALALGLGRDQLPGLWVFSDNGGQDHWHIQMPTCAWADAADQAGLGAYHLHDLRHFAASNMVVAGLNTQAVAKRLGCTEGNVIRTYSHHIETEDDTRAADLLAQLLA